MAESGTGKQLLDKSNKQKGKPNTKSAFLKGVCGAFAEKTPFTFTLDFRSRSYWCGKVNQCFAETFSPGIMTFFRTTCSQGRLYYDAFH